MAFSDAPISDVAWAAGLFEGEGSISFHRTSIRLSLGMTDEDVVQRFREIVGVGNITSNEERRQPHWKTCYSWELSRYEAVVEVMERLLPFLGERRTARWLEVRDLRAATRPEERECPECHGRFTPRRRNTICCSHDCSWNHSRRVGRYTDRKRPPSGIRRPRKLDHEEVLRLQAEGLTRGEIAERLGVSRQAIYHHLPTDVGIARRAAAGLSAFTA